MRIFVTGGSGFLGSRIIQTLVAEEHQVFRTRPVHVINRAGSRARATRTRRS